MKEILNHHTINEHTMALLPAAQLGYDTIVLEREIQLFVRKTPIQLIHIACFLLRQLRFT